MPTFRYIATQPYTPFSNNSYINKKEYNFKECAVLPLNDKDSLWNANKCPNDKCYCQPYVQGDKIYLQFNLTQFVAGTKAVIFELVDDNTDETIDDTGIITTQQGYDDNDVLFANLVIDTTNFTKCFYVRANIFNCIPDPVTLADCIAEGIANGLTQKAAEIACYIEACGPSGSTSYITEPYCSVPCNKKTLLLEGFYPKYDCNGKFYGTFQGGALSIYKPQLRVYGTNEWYTHTTEETLVNRYRTRSRGIDKYRLRTEKIPPYVTAQIAIIMDAQRKYVEGVEYKGGTTFSKDFEEGGSWILTIDLFTECPENNFGCN